MTGPSEVPPGSAERFAPDGPPGSLRLGALLLGLFVDQFGTRVFMTVVAVILMATNPKLVEPNGLSQPAQLLLMFCGLLFTVLGGFVTARFAGRDFCWHAVIMGALTLTMGALQSHFGQTGPDPSPFWMSALGYVVTIPGAVLGGYLAFVTRPATPTEG